MGIRRSRSQGLRISPATQQSHVVAGQASRYVLIVESTATYPIQLAMDIQVSQPGWLATIERKSTDGELAQSWLTPGDRASFQLTVHPPRMRPGSNTVVLRIWEEGEPSHAAQASVETLPIAHQELHAFSGSSPNADQRRFTTT